MKGKHHITVQNNRLRYELDIKRNITIICGDSATGKTTLIQMLEQYANLSDESGIDVICDKEVQVLSGRNWKAVLASLDDQIIFIDEENAFIKTEDFASCVRGSTCYFVLATRENLPNLPYSVEEIYGIHTSGKYHDTRRVFNEMYHLYSLSSDHAGTAPEMVITEDANSGFAFFSALARAKDIPCKSAEGKSNLVKAADDCGCADVLIVGDGAAIGPEMNELYQLMNRSRHIRCYLPESFEWLILKSGLIDGKELQQILQQPENYIESSEYFSWERYFTKILMDYTKDTFRQYSKLHLNPFYLQEHEKKRIHDVLPDLGL